jgi:hypothetical protein
MLTSVKGAGNYRLVDVASDLFIGPTFRLMDRSSSTVSTVPDGDMPTEKRPAEAGHLPGQPHKIGNFKKLDVWSGRWA